jgi:2-desacetyl-2-hydroxyethyl bacteriochlorophyllide A dehydrogenase
MKALIWQGIENIGLETVEDPRLEGPSDVIVEVERAAICGSDLHVYHGRETGLDTGTVMGHEFIGRVAEIGPDVRRFRKGDRVCSPFTTNCGSCFFCRKGLTSRCLHGELFGWVADGRGLHGGQAEAVRIPLGDATLVAVPDGVDDEEALLLCDVLCTGFYCADRGEVAGGDVVVVLGCGPVGLMAVIGARERGVETIFAVDSVAERLTLARGYGAAPIDLGGEEPVETIREQTDGRGADAVLEAVGSPAAGRLAVDLVRPGGIISTAGVHTERQLSFSPVEAYDKNLTYRSGRCPARAYMDRLLPLVCSRKYFLTEVFSHRMSLAEGPEGYRLFAGRRDGCTKVALQPD